MSSSPACARVSVRLVANIRLHAWMSHVQRRRFTGGQVLAMENLLRQLERQEGLMSHIQKALGEYLEGQRQVTASISCCLNISHLMRRYASVL